MLPKNVAMNAKVKKQINSIFWILLTVDVLLTSLLFDWPQSALSKVFGLYGLLGFLGIYRFTAGSILLKHWRVNKKTKSVYRTLEFSMIFVWLLSAILFLMIYFGPKNSTSVLMFITLPFLNYVIYFLTFLISVLVYFIVKIKRPKWSR